MILKRVEFEYAKDFGNISPNSSNSRNAAAAVVVAATGPPGALARRTTMADEIEKYRILTSMLPNSNEVSNCFEFFERFAAKRQSRCSDLRKATVCLCERLRNAVSEPEKKPEAKISNSIVMRCQIFSISRDTGPMINDY